MWNRDRKNEHGWIWKSGHLLENNSKGKKKLKSYYYYSQTNKTIP